MTEGPRLSTWAFKILTVMFLLCFLLPRHTSRPRETQPDRHLVEASAVVVTGEDIEVRRQGEVLAHSRIVAESKRQAEAFCSTEKAPTSTSIVANPRPPFRKKPPCALG